MRSEQINEIAAALAKAQSTMRNAVLNRTNPHFRSKYADLASIFDAVREPLSANGIAITQTIDAHVLTTMLMHTSGQWLGSQMDLPETSKPQELGSALTYYRRYSLAGLVGIGADDDDDAEAAQAQPQPPPKKQPKKFEISRIPVDVMAREAAQRGHAALAEFYATLDDEGKTKVQEMQRELEQLYPAADGAG
jgi:hypothetical protein